MLLVNRAFVPPEKKGFFWRKWRKWRICILTSKTRVLLLEARETTKMTKMAGVPRARAWFTKSTVSWTPIKSVHYHHRKKIIWGTFLASKKHFPSPWWIQKPYENQENHIYHRNLSSVPPFFRQGKVLHWSRAVYAFFFPGDRAWRGTISGKFRKILTRITTRQKFKDLGHWRTNVQQLTSNIDVSCFFIIFLAFLFSLS